MFKNIFLGTTKFGWHKKLEGNAPECPPWLPACRSTMVPIRRAARTPLRAKPRWCKPVFFKENVRYPVWTYREPISLILGTRFFLILGTRW